MREIKKEEKILNQNIRNIFNIKLFKINIIINLGYHNKAYIKYVLLIRFN